MKKSVAIFRQLSYTTCRFEGDVPQRDRSQRYLFLSAPRSGFPFSNHPQSASDSSPQEDKTLRTWALTHTSVSSPANSYWELLPAKNELKEKPYKKSCCGESYGSPTTSFLQGERGRLFIRNGINLIIPLLHNSIWGGIPCLEK